MAHVADEDKRQNKVWSFTVNSDAMDTLGHTWFGQAHWRQTTYKTTDPFITDSEETLTVKWRQLEEVLGLIIKYAI